MGLFDSLKKSKEVQKEAEWKVGLMPTFIEFYEDYLQLVSTGATDTIFYKDIMSVEQSAFVVTLRTNVKTFALTSRKKRGGTDRAIALQHQILEKIAEKK